MRRNGGPAQPTAAGIPAGRARWERILPATMALVLLAAFALRAYGLGRHSLSGDEIWSVLATQASWDKFWETDPLLVHPPLYFFALRGWLGLAGHSEYAVRFPSAVAGTATVALVYALGRRLLSPLAGYLATLLATSSALFILSSQDAKVYMPAAALSALSVYLMLRLLESGRARDWAAWTASAGACIFIAYAPAVVILFEAVILGYAVWRGGWGKRLSRRHWLVSHACLVLAAAGWMAWSGAIARVYSIVLSPWPEKATGGASAIRFSNVLHYPTVGQLGTDTASAVTLAVTGTVALWGLWRLRDRPRAAAVLGAYLLLPMLALAAITWGRHGLAPRHLLPVAAAFYLSLSAGLTSFRRGFRALAVGVLLLFLFSNARSLYPYYGEEYWYDPWYARDDFRSAAAYLDENVRDGDTVLVASPAGLPLLEYYTSRHYNYGSLGTAPTAEAAIENGSLTALWGKAPRLWLVSYQPWLYDPQERMKAWLDERGDVFAQADFPYISVRGYSTQPHVSRERPSVQYAVEATLGDIASLLGYDVDLDEAVTRGRLYVTLYWRALKKRYRSYSVFVHLLNKDGSIAAQKDNRPVADLWPTYMWEPGTYIRDEYRIDLASASPRGAYRLVVGMYEPRSGERLPVAETGADSIDLGTLTLPSLPDARRPPSP